MWLITTRGYSAVEDHQQPGCVRVRARAHEDLTALADVIPSLVVEETPDRDYRFRASVAREAWASAVAQLAREIDYPNFKNAVAGRQGSKRAHVYGEVWATPLGLQEGGRYG